MPSPTAPQPPASEILHTRRATDPHYRFPLSTTQLRFAKSPALFRVVQGGNRTGKTAVACWDAAGVFRGCHPFKPFYGPGRYLLITESRQQMAEVVGRKLLLTV